MKLTLTNVVDATTDVIKEHQEHLQVHVSYLVDAYHELKLSPCKTHGYEELILREIEFYRKILPQFISTANLNK